MSDIRSLWDEGDPQGPAGFKTWGEAVSDALGVERADAGVYTVTTNENGTVVVTHGWDFTPDLVVGTPQAPRSGSNIFGAVVIDDFTATTFRIRCFAPTGEGLAELQVTLQAIGIKLS